MFNVLLYRSYYTFYGYKIIDTAMNIDLLCISDIVGQIAAYYRRVILLKAFVLQFALHTVSLFPWCSQQHMHKSWVL